MTAGSNVYKMGRERQDITGMWTKQLFIIESQYSSFPVKK